MNIKNLMFIFFLTTIFSTAAYSSNNMSLQDTWANVCKSQSVCKWQANKCVYNYDPTMQTLCEKTTLTIAHTLVKMKPKANTTSNSLVGNRAK